MNDLHTDNGYHEAPTGTGRLADYFRRHGLLSTDHGETPADPPEPKARRAGDNVHSPSSPGKTTSSVAGRSDQAAEPTPARESQDGRMGRFGRFGRILKGYGGVLNSVARFLGDYVVLPEDSLLVVSAWVIAAWLAEDWDRFPHLAISSPEKRCGKTTLLDLLALIVPRPRYTTNISPAAVYRLIEVEKPTLLIDEAQSLKRLGSESSEVMREILNASINKNAKVMRCGGEGRTQLQEFSIYSPKVFALIGAPDEVLADRSLSITMRRKTADEPYPVERYRSRVVEPRGAEVRSRVEKWVTEHREAVKEVYDNNLEPFDINNDRLAELLLPLQAVLEVVGRVVPGGKRPLELLYEFAQGLEGREDDAARMTPGVRLLADCREIFKGVKETPDDGRFLATAELIGRLTSLEEAPWANFNGRGPITPHALAKLLGLYEIKSTHNRAKSARGYCANAFDGAWRRYCPPTPSPLNETSQPSEPSDGERGDR